MKRLVVGLLIFVGIASAENTMPNRYYKGTIGDTYPFLMGLSQQGKLKGSYIYNSQNRSIYLEGSKQKNGTTLYRELSGEKCTGMFEGVFTADTMYGKWNNAKRTKSFSFTGKPVPLTGKAIIPLCAGEYVLDFADGSCGANGMFSYSRDTKGGWQFGGSSISGGMRESWDDTKISAAEVKFLNSLKIIVAPNGTVSMNILGKTVMTIPISDTTHCVRIKKDLDYIEMYGDTFHTNTTTFIDDKLCLAFQDSITFKFPEECIEVSDQMILDIYPADKRIELNFGYLFDRIGYFFIKKSAASKSPL